MIGHNREKLEHNGVYYCGEMPKSILGKIWGIMYVYSGLSRRSPEPPLCEVVRFLCRPK